MIVPHSIQRPSFGVIDFLSIVFFYGLLLFNGLTYTLVFLPFIMAYYLTSSGIQYDPQSKSIRGYKSLLSFRFGTWQDLEKVEKVLLKRSQYKVNNFGPYDSVKHSSVAFKYTILLPLPNSREPIEIGSYTDEEQAVQCVKAIESSTHLPVFIPFRK